jgi:fibronectin type III domain protein
MTQPAATVAAVAAVLVALGLNPVTAATGRTAPSAPRSVEAEAGTGSVKVSWRPPARAGAQGVDRYRVVRWAPTVARRNSTVSSRKRSLTITGLVPGRKYSFKVLAHNARGWGQASKTVSAVPAATGSGSPVPTPTPTPTPSPSPTPSATPSPGFGVITGPYGVVAPELPKTTPSLFSSRLDFGSNPYDDPDDRPLLTAGARMIIEGPNAGGSSLFSEVFAFEMLARSEGASLLKLETEIVYDQAGKKSDLLIQIAGQKVGVSITRAVSFPAGSAYTEQQAAAILAQKLNDIRESSQNVSAQDAWVKQVLVVMAQSDMHADAIEAAWLGLDAQTKSDTVVYVVVTDGSDDPLYYSP